ncbi:adenylosuccinate synthase [Candidatus Woesearchaeota archaeon]|jgi:adenylosuccinate synthase|nr:adenylosuccinate synthase [Candidatus Woesearchaeota archaeon]MBT4110255.1 adenylosuccinate synthase [Candidatus Woesearchaeota archaeon]MBT4336221.1 adenylosuccinate synthase [Candidatus Woesearchaeota archaeon]MBT4468800.1 adenylosuccinate synthase [Candidatus Woesearchaeota archaeon]MBT6744881.1 adenylosuccinate synthase [Candidatus Woesearchaeota archaeon]
MGNTFAILGGQWGDEGKGKFVDWAAKYFDISARATGGNNAGHTVYVGEEKHIFHLIPSAITWKNVDCLLGNGMVIDPLILLKEIDTLEQKGYTVNNLYISGRAHMILLYNKVLDKYKEKSKGKKKVGTTGRGIGPTYADKAYYTGIRMNDLLDKELLKRKVSLHVWEKFGSFKKLHEDDDEIIMGALRDSLPEDTFFDKWRSKLLDLGNNINLNKLTNFFVDIYFSVGKILKKHITDTRLMLESNAKDGKSILLEGAQGLLLDVDHGTYPFVTSSNASIGGLKTGLGLPHLDIAYSVVKAYTTRVGEGPFATELFDDVGNYLREKGGEFGSTTGRPRRCGWHDTVLTRHTALINGPNIVISKLDVLTGLEKLKICNSYKYLGPKKVFNGEIYFTGKILKDFPADGFLLEHCVPHQWVEMPGWTEDITNVKEYSLLPINAQNYLRKIEELGNVEISLVSIGPKREQMIVMPGRWNLEVKQEKVSSSSVSEPVEQPIEERETFVEPTVNVETESQLETRTEIKTEPEEDTKIKAIIYDMDNTLVNTDGFVLGHLRRTALRVCQDIPFTVPSDEEIKRVQKENLPFEDIFVKLFPNPLGYIRDEPLSGVVLAKYREDAKEIPFSSTLGGIDLVETMSKQEVVQGIVTNRVRMARHRLDQAGYSDFSFIVQPESKEQSKPNPLCLRPALDFLQEKNISKSEVLSVGDHPDDYLAARDAGITFIAVLTGESTKGDFISAGLDANMIVDDLGELKEIIN